jgi:hypothetical protein
MPQPWMACLRMHHNGRHIIPENELLMKSPIEQKDELVLFVLLHHGLQYLVGESSPPIKAAMKKQTGIYGNSQ